MSKNYYLFLLSFLGFSLIITQNSFAQSKNLSQGDTASDTIITAVLYPMPNCGCCGKYANYLNHHGFTVQEKKVSSTNELKEVAKKDNVPLIYRKQRMSMHTGICHITEIENYTVIGHVPANIVQRLLKQKPKNIAGVILPGMPSGSPGMTMGMSGMNMKKKPLVIYAFNRNGKTWVYERVHDAPPYTPIQ